MTSIQIPQSVAAALPTLSVFDITNEVQRDVGAGAPAHGIAYISAAVPTSLVRVSERESGFFCDVEALLERIVPGRAPTVSACCSRCSARARSRSRSLTVGCASGMAAGAALLPRRRHARGLHPDARRVRLLLAALAVALLAAPGRGRRGQAEGDRHARRGALDLRRRRQHRDPRGDQDGAPCDSGSVWTPASGKVVRFVDENCSKNGADRHFMALTLAGSRAAWTDYDYGNHAYCIGPVTATLAAPRASNSGVCPDEPDNEDMYVEYKGDGSLLVGRSWLQCDSSCGPDYTGSYQDDVVLYTISSKVKKLADEKRNTDLLDVDAGRILLRVEEDALRPRRLGQAGGGAGRFPAGARRS